MGKKLHYVQVAGKEKHWMFEVYADPNDLKDAQADGVDIVLVENVIPAWIVDIGLAKIWCSFQDLMNFKNPFKD